MGNSIEERRAIARMTDEELMSAGLWKVRGGQAIRIADMTDLHIKRCIAKIMDCGGVTERDKAWVQFFREELEKRNMTKIKEYSHDEYLAGLHKEIADIGLVEAVKKRCDLIDDECRDMGYVRHRTIQEWLCEIMDLVKDGEQE